MCPIPKTFMYVLNFHWPCDLPEFKDITHLLKERSLYCGSIKKYQMKRVLPASPSFIKLENVTNSAWILWGRRYIFLPVLVPFYFWNSVLPGEKSSKKPQIPIDPVLHILCQHQLTVKGLEQHLNSVGFIPPNVMYQKVKYLNLS